MARPATHYGHCQVCGRQHKVYPHTGLVALHGYTVKKAGPYSWFTASCWGAKELPFQHSCELVKKSIVWAREQLDEVKAEHEKTIAMPKKPRCWRNVYLKPEKEPELVKHLPKSGGYIWLRFEISHETKTSDGYSYPIWFARRLDKVSQPLRMDTHGVSTKEDIYVAWNLNLDYARRVLEPKIAELERYIAEQQARVDAWAFVDLIPLKPEPSREYVRVVNHWNRRYVGLTATVVRREGEKVIVRIAGDRRQHYLAATSVEAIG